MLQGMVRGRGLFSQEQRFGWWVTEVSMTDVLQYVEGHSEQMV